MGPEVKVKRVVSAPPTRDQKVYLVDFLEANIYVARKQHLHGENGQKDLAGAWENISVELNAFGGCNKEADQWKKYWEDLKLRTKTKASKQKEAYNKTGVNGTKPIKKLQDIEKRILSIISAIGVDGDDTVEEVGESDFETITVGHIVKDFQEKNVPGCNSWAPSKRSKNGVHKKSADACNVDFADACGVEYLEDSFEIDLTEEEVVSSAKKTHTTYNNTESSKRARCDDDFFPDKVRISSTPKATSSKLFKKKPTFEELYLAQLENLVVLKKEEIAIKHEELDIKREELDIKRELLALKKLKWDETRM